MKRSWPFFILGTILVLFFGGMDVFWLNNNCPELSPRNCQFMWGVFIVSVLIGFLLLEMLLARKKAQGDWKVKLPQDRSSNDSESLPSDWYILLRPIVWFTLAVLLGGLPLLVQGSFAVTLTGVLAGVFLAGLIRGMTNRLPPIEKDNQT